MARLERIAAIVTGAAQGIGATYARALAAEGARVSLCDLDPPDTVVQAIREAGGEAIGRICDVSAPKAVAALVRATEQAFGSIQVLVNNAALFGKIALKPLSEIASEEWDQLRVATITVRCARSMSRAAHSNARKRRMISSGCCLFLASHDSDFMTGQTLLVDGGSAMH